MQHFSVETEQLRTHASNLLELEEMARTAQDAAQQVKTQSLDLAYGQLCQAFPMTIHQVEEQAFGLIHSAVAALRNTQDNLRKSADDYTETDEQQKGNFQDIGKHLR